MQNIMMRMMTVSTDMTKPANESPLLRPCSAQVIFSNTFKTQEAADQDTLKTLKKGSTKRFSARGQRAVIEQAKRSCV